MVTIPIGQRRDLAVLERAVARVIAAADRRARQRATAPLATTLASALRRGFRQQEGAVLDALAARRDRLERDLAAARESRIVRQHWLTEADPPDYWDQALADALAGTLEDLAVPIQTAVETAVQTGANTAGATLRISGSFTLDNPAAVGYSEQYAAELVTRINETTRAGINSLVTEAVADGWSYQDLAGAIRETYSGFHTPQPQQHIRDRAEMVAVTEVGNAYEAGTLQTAQLLQQAGLPMEKSWLTVGDDRVDPDCLANEAAGWIPADDPFPSGDMRPLAHPNCRCTALFRRAESAGAPAGTVDPRDIPGMTPTGTSSATTRTGADQDAPATRAVGDTITLDGLGGPRSRLRKAADAALAAIDKIHKMPAGTIQIPATTTRSQKYAGALHLQRNRATGGLEPTKIELSHAGTHPALTMAHEMGHFLSATGIGDPGKQIGWAAGSPEYTAAVRAWGVAVQESEAYKGLIALQEGPTTQTITTASGQYRVTVDKRYVAYLLETDELWARSYAQYITVTSGDATMQAELEDDLARQRGSIVKNPKQWESADFEPIRVAIDGVLRAGGLLE